MRKLIFVALLTAAPLFTLGSTPAAAFGCDWFGYGYRSATVAPRAYSYAPTRRYYRPRVTRAYYGGALYRPRLTHAYYGRTLYRPRAYGRAAYRPGVTRAYGYRAVRRGVRRVR